MNPFIPLWRVAVLLSSFVLLALPARAVAPDESLSADATLIVIEN